MPYQKCKICNAEFYAKLNWIRRGHGKYCSRACQYKGQLKGKLINCFICKKQTYKPRGDLKKSKSKKYFCGKSCQTIWRNSIMYSGKNHPNWKNGKSTYKRVLLCDKRERICQRCKNGDKRILVVHHLDSDRANNKLSNLIWLCNNCHFLIHHYKQEKEEFMETLV